VKKKIVKIVLVICSILILVIGLLALSIYSYRNTTSDVHADAAIVLGAAVWGNQLSPVFRERVNHAINLYRSGRVRKLIFTGGQGNPGEQAESFAARQYARQSGVPAGDIFIEDRSHTTYENLLYAKSVADDHGLKKVLIVSDPLHMKRAMVMAGEMGMEAYPSPTPTTRYQSVKSQVGLLAYETFYYVGYLLSRPFVGKVARELRR
jgi:uncharacterized SAM-binding protein YcdF (DUF218 family)